MHRGGRGLGAFLWRGEASKAAREHRRGLPPQSRRRRSWQPAPRSPPRAPGAPRSQVEKALEPEKKEYKFEVGRGRRFLARGVPGGARGGGGGSRWGAHARAGLRMACRTSSRDTSPRGARTASPPASPPSRVPTTGGAARDRRRRAGGRHCHVAMAEEALEEGRRARGRVTSDADQSRTPAARGVFSGDPLRVRARVLGQARARPRALHALTARTAMNDSPWRCQECKTSDRCHFKLQT
jgi:hypothetical protein